MVVAALLGIKANADDVCVRVRVRRQYGRCVNKINENMLALSISMYAIFCLYHTIHTPPATASESIAESAGRHHIKMSVTINMQT